MYKKLKRVIPTVTAFDSSFLTSLHCGWLLWHYGSDIGILILVAVVYGYESSHVGCADLYWQAHTGSNPRQDEDSELSVAV